MDTSEFNRNRFQRKLEWCINPDLVRQLKGLWSFVQSAPPAADLALAMSALIYFAVPVDAIFDSIPLVGLVDDALFVATVVAALGSKLLGHLIDDEQEPCEPSSGKEL